MMLLERKGRGVTVTEAGKLVYDYFLRHQSLRRDLAVQSFIESYSNISFNVVTDSTHGAQKRLRYDEFMIGLLVTNAPSPSLYRHLSHSEQIYAIVRVGHPLTKINRELQLSDLLSYNGYLTPPDFRLRQIIAAAEFYERPALNTTITASCLDIVRAAIVEGDGYTLIPWRGVEAEIDEGKLVTLPINNPVLREVETCIVSCRGRMLAPAARAFAKQLVYA